MSIELDLLASRHRMLKVLRFSSGYVLFTVPQTIGFLVRCCLIAFGKKVMAVFHRTLERTWLVQIIVSVKKAAYLNRSSVISQ